MIDLWHKITFRPTFFSVISMLLILISIPLGIYNYTKSDASTEGWVLTFMLILYIGIGILYSTDRFFVLIINPNILTIIEIVLTLLCYIFLMYYTRKLAIDMTNSKQEFVLIIENPGQLTNTQYSTKSIFDKEIKSTENIIIVDNIPNSIDLKQRPKSWNDAHYYNKYSFDKYENVVLYSSSELKINDCISETFIDSLVKNKR